MMTFIEQFLCARHGSKCFTSFVLHNLYNHSELGTLMLLMTKPRLIESSKLYMSHRNSWVRA